jgi:hypothetical protein
VTVKIKLDRVTVREVPKALVTPLVCKVGVRVERAARSRVQVASGTTRSKIKGKLKVGATKVTYRVTSGDRKTMLLHEGSPRHRIEAKPGGPMLRFYWAKVGHIVTFRAVNHPGFGGSKFLTAPLILHGARNRFRVTISVGGLRGTI